MLEKTIQDKWFVAGLLTSLIITFMIYNFISYPPELSSNHWLKDDEIITDILETHVQTKYPYLNLGKPKFYSSKGGSYVPFWGRYDVWRRGFSYYPFDPDTTPDDENYRLSGFVYADGIIELYHHVTADTYYV